MNKRLYGCILLCIVTLIWGGSFAAQKSGMDYIGPHTFNFARSVLAAVVLLPTVVVTDKFKAKKTGVPKAEASPEDKKNLIKYGIINGIVCFAIMVFQQIGISHTEASKAAFITAMYIVIVPILGLAIGQKMRIIEAVCVVLATFGLYQLCIPAGAKLTLEMGDFLVLINSFLCALQVYVVVFSVAKVDAVRLSCMQFAVCAVLCAIPTFIFETPTIDALIAGALPLFYAGALSSAVACTLQIVALKYVPPTAASFITSLESVFGVFTSVLLLGETLTGREALGCVIMFVAILIAQIPEKKAPEEASAEAADNAEVHAAEGIK